MRIIYRRRLVLLTLFIAGQVVNGQGQVRDKQDPDNLVRAEQGSDNINFSPWQWKGVDSAFGPLPASMHVFKTEDSVVGRPSIAYYVSVPLSEPAVAFTSQIGYGKRWTPAQYYQQEGQPLLVVNTSFFSFVTNANRDLVVKDGKIVSWNDQSRRPKGKDSLAYYMYATHSALGITGKRKADIAWTFTDSISQWPYAFEGGPVTAQGQDSIPSLKALNNRHWRRWKVQTAVGGGPVLIHDGIIRVTNKEEGLFVGSEKARNPRTAIGYTRDGRLIVLAIQGRTPGRAAGLTLAEEAKVLLDLGCYEALNLDGGGSTCLLVNGKETIHPSDKTGERPVPSVFIIKKN